MTMVPPVIKPAEGKMKSTRGQRVYDKVAVTTEKSSRLAVTETVKLLWSCGGYNGAIIKGISHQTNAADELSADAATVK